MQTTGEMYALTARTHGGLEQVLADELRGLGAADIQVVGRAVRFRGDRRLLYAANIHCRTAIRIVRTIASFPARNEDEFYDAVRLVDWTELLSPDGTLAVDAMVRSSFLTHSLYAAQLAKDAIVDQFRDRFGRRPTVDRTAPQLRIALQLHDDELTLALDASGDSLHKRGYRRAAGEAPLNEALAAGILRLTEWDRSSPLYDFMCGSGTLPIEAALWARNMAPGLLRRRFGYQGWPDFDAALHRQLLSEARSRVLPRLEFPIIGSDLDERVIALARENARQAGVAQDVSFEALHFEAARPRPGGWSLQESQRGVVVVNPPWDQRLRTSQIAAVYRRIGDALKQNFGGHRAWIFTGNLEAARFIGLRASRKIPLFDGPTECRLLSFDLFAPRPLTDEPATRPAVRERDAGGLDEERGVEGDGNDSREAFDDRAAELQDDDFDERFADESLDDASSSDASSGDAGSPAARRGAAPTGLLKQPDSAGESSRARRPRRTWQQQAEEFSNRLRRMARHWGKWARRQGITCYRLYDRDMPEAPLAIDWYEGWLHVAEYLRPHDRTEIEHQVWLQRMVESAAAALAVDPAQTVLKQRRRQRDHGQYQRHSDQGRAIVVSEGGLKFEVNLTDYLDTGLFLDHRQTRAMVREAAAGRRVLNLFAYTGTFSVYAADGGAASTTTVDLSNTYLDWAERNLRLNGFVGRQHELVRDDVLGFLRHAQRDPYDLAIVDVPTHSRSKRTQFDWDVQRDHVELLHRLAGWMAPGGLIYFASNFRRFKFDQESLTQETLRSGRRLAIREISRQTVPPDFRNKRIHRCWAIRVD